MRGFHFCVDLKECFSYYNFDPDNKVAEIEAFGDIDRSIDIAAMKYCTNKIKIIRELSWEEVLREVNKGKGNTGFNNNGNCNSGCYNIGRYNTGSYNKGSWNSGNHNIGCGNSGEWNKTSFSSGCFNTNPDVKIYMFNKPSPWTHKDWFASRARFILKGGLATVSEWIPSKRMTNEEKEQYPTYKESGGYVKKTESGLTQLWWDNLPDSDKIIVKDLPNFDSTIFKEITGVDTTI